jgi:hypothetical protein
MHARLELAVDRSTRRIEALAKPSVRVQPVESVWNVTTEGLRRSNALVDEIMEADRRARAAGGGDQREYASALMKLEDRRLAAQIADSASRLASIWLYEWQQAGRPAGCTARAD